MFVSGLTFGRKTIAKPGRQPGHRPVAICNHIFCCLFPAKTPEEVLQGIKPIPQREVKSKKAAGRQGQSRHLTSDEHMKKAEQKAKEQDKSEGKGQGKGQSATAKASTSADVSIPLQIPKKKGRQALKPGTQVVVAKRVQPKLSFICAICDRSYRENQSGSWIKCGTCEAPAHYKCAGDTPGLFCPCGETYYLK